jgi:hypothetical protein
MSEAQRQKMVYIFAGVIVAVTLYVQFGLKVKIVTPDPIPAIATVTIDPVSTIQPVAASTASATVTLTRRNSFVLNESWGSDPFAPRSIRRIARGRDASQSNAPQLPILDWRLGGIIYLPSKPVAYVNDQPVHVGQIIDGALVSEITKNSVVLNVRGERKTLTLGKG